MVNEFDTQRCVVMISLRVMTPFVYEKFVLSLTFRIGCWQKQSKNKRLKRNLKVRKFGGGLPCDFSSRTVYAAFENILSADNTLYHLWKEIRTPNRELLNWFLERCLFLDHRRFIFRNSNYYMNFCKISLYSYIMYVIIF